MIQHTVARSPRRRAAVLGLAVALTFPTIAPALADSDRHRNDRYHYGSDHFDRRHGHGHRRFRGHHQDRHHHGAPHHSYAPYPVYIPPPVYYPAPYYTQPSITLVFPFNLGHR